MTFIPRFLTYFILVAAVLGCTSFGARKPTTRPNVLFIAIDDLRPELGAYGVSGVHTPHLDSLASLSAFFTRHYVQVPTCGASRYSLLTGMRPSNRVQLTNEAIAKEVSNTPEREKPESFIHHFRRAGYRTVGIGKIGHSADGYLYGYTDPVSDKRELPYSWDELYFDPGKWKTGWNAFFGYANGENRQSLHKQVKPYEQSDTDDSGYVDGLTAALAVEKLRDLGKDGQPFFMGVGFFKPHLPFTAPKRYWDLYADQEIPLPANPKIPDGVDPGSLHNSGEFNLYGLGPEKPDLEHPVSDSYARKIHLAYWAAVSYVDAQVGKLLKALQDTGLDRNTIVVVWGDHGWHLGEQRVWGKHTLFENALRSPLIVRAPSLENAVGRVEAVAETVDIYPTLLELCGLEAPYPTDGKSLVTAMAEKETRTDTVAYSYFNQGISIRTPSYRLTHYFRNAVPITELYDHRTDSLETRNIAGKNPAIVQALMPLLEMGYSGFYETQ